MKQPTIEEIEKSMIKNKFVVFTQPYSVNLGGIRTLDNKANTFNDFLFSFYYNEKGEKIGIVIPGTTDAGVYYRKKPMNKQGTAIVQDGVQHRGVYQLQDPAKNPKQPGHNGKKAFRQIKPMAYWRDNDKDIELEGEGKTYIENGATNIHYMGTVGKLVDNWSAGCGGATVANLDRLMAVAQKQIDAGLGDIYSYSLIHEKNF